MLMRTGDKGVVSPARPMRSTTGGSNSLIETEERTRRKKGVSDENLLHFGRRRSKYSLELAMLNTVDIMSVIATASQTQKLSPPPGSLLSVEPVTMARWLRKGRRKKMKIHPALR